MPETFFKRYKIDEHAYHRLQRWAPELNIKIGDSFTVEEFEHVKSEILVKFGFPPTRLKLTKFIAMLQTKPLSTTTLKMKNA